VTEAGGNVMVVAGPAVIHSGAGDALAELVEAGYVDALSAGQRLRHPRPRALAVRHLARDGRGDARTPAEGPQTPHLTISEIIRAGGIEAAVEDGIIGEGVMYQCVQNDVDTVLAGSIRDDGPLPDTITDAVEAQNAIRDQAHDADIVLMLATLLHSVAVGNCLPSTTKTVCVDINPATVTQLLDRGSAQAGRDGHRHRDVRPHARGVRAGRGGGGSERRGGDHRGLRRVTAALRPYDPETDADALYEMKTAFERGLGESTGGDEKAAAYEGKLTDDYRESWLAWVDRCVSDDERCVTVAVEEEEGNDPNLVGYVFVLPERLAMIWDAAVINELYVVPESRGTGRRRRADGRRRRARRRSGPPARPDRARRRPRERAGPAVLRPSRLRAVGRDGGAFARRLSLLSRRSAPESSEPGNPGQELCGCRYHLHV